MRAGLIWARVASSFQGEHEESGGLSSATRNSSSGRSINRGRVRVADLLLEHPRVNVEALSNRTPLFRVPSARATSNVPSTFVAKSTRHAARLCSAPTGEVIKRNEYPIVP